MKSIPNSKITVRYMGAPIAEVAKHTHEETVSYCDYRGKPLSRSDVNDYGTLCERCYMREYYNEND
jgi:hypothetical protein